MQAHLHSFLLPRKTRKDTKKLRVGPNAIRADRSEQEVPDQIAEFFVSFVLLVIVTFRRAISRLNPENDTGFSSPPAARENPKPVFSVPPHNDSTACMAYQLTGYD